jgi:nucleoside 2-deoxyribosyltransferase
MLFYLAGSIEYSPDLGKGWRAEIAPALKALGHEIYDPAEDEMKNLTEAEARRTIQKITAYDLDLIEHRCDAIVCYWDQHAGRGAGTQGELTFAHRMGIPVYLVCGMPVEQISGWLLGCATEVFCSFDEFQEFAARLSSEVGADVET